MTERRRDFFTLVFTLIPLTWAGSFIAGAYVVREMNPALSVFWRFACSAAVMVPGLVVFRRSRHPNLADSGWWLHLSILVILSGIGYHLLFFWGLESTNPTVAALVIALNPFFTAIGEVLFLRIQRPVRFYLGFGCALAGAFLVIIVRGTGDISGILGGGPLICLGAAVAWSAYTLAAKATRRPQWDALWLNAYGYVLTALLVFPLLRSPVIPAEGFRAETWAGAWYMGIFPTAIGYTLFYIGVQRKGPAWASAFIYAVPICAAILDVLFFGAPFTLGMGVGTLMVVGGLFLAMRR